MRFVHCSYDEHAEAILAIFNHAILNTTALYEYKPRTMTTMQQWFANKAAGSFPGVGPSERAGPTGSFWQLWHLPGFSGF